MANKKRADIVLVERGLADSRGKAQALILAGRVFSGQTQINKSGNLLSEDVSIRIIPSKRFVGRGGIKLEYALQAFKVNVQDRLVLDIGASTGGFTHCLLEHGAELVYALDVGYGQLDYRLRGNPRVKVMERVNARQPFELPDQVSLATIDVSFISLIKIIPSVVEHIKPREHLIALIKPQFEAGPEHVGKGGVVRDPTIHALTIGRVCLWSIRYGLRIRGVVPSPIEGATGNREFFVLLQKRGASQQDLTSAP
jgi:23S rRNA (cytidine1920-2'-O)/16S rRNA (cytidine1409-2'-O)-methyltransferase